ncbi:MAG: sugar phosphate isomerase/epimerase [Eubacteriales bacterium]|nr:sugar phosphate isomerase/epimerase [Eubacteriales bacterium]
MRKIDLGMPSLLECGSFAENLRLRDELGLDFLEVNMNLPWAQALSARELRAGGAYCTLHLDENADPCSFDEEIARAWRQSVRRCIRLAKEAGVPLLNMHLPQGVYFSMPQGKVYLADEYWPQFSGLLSRFRDECAAEVGSEGPMIALENTRWPGMAHLREAAELLLQAECFCLCYDAGHDRSGCARPFFEAHAGRWKHMHLHDADARGDHKPLGEGDMDWQGALRAAEANGVERVVLEVKTQRGLREGIARYKEKRT